MKASVEESGRVGGRVCVMRQTQLEKTSDGGLRAQRLLTLTTTADTLEYGNEDLVILLNIQ